MEERAESVGIARREGSVSVSCFAGGIGTVECSSGWAGQKPGGSGTLP
jgi:hypothetical protein